MRKPLIICLLSASMMLCHIGALAEERWCAVMGPVDIPLDDIECFVATDGENTLSVVLSSGMVLSSVPSVSFALRDPNGIEDIVADSDILLINNKIHISRAVGCDVASVVNTSGSVVASVRVSGGECAIDLTDAPSGVYILTLGNKAIKFAKR